MASPRSSAAAITSASRTDPPGCTTAVAPASATRRGRRGTGRTRPRPPPTRERFRRCLHHRDFDRIDAAHLARADRQRPIGAGEDHRVRFHVRATRQANRSAVHSSAVGWRLRHDLRERRRAATAPGASVTRSRSCASSPPRMLRKSFARSKSPPATAIAAPAKSAVTTRMFGFAARIVAAASVDRRRDHGLDERGRRSPSRRPTSIGRFSPTMPPNAESGSASRART